MPSTKLTFDVFLSFRGKDSRHNFTGHLYKALCDRGIYTFFDEDDLPRGDKISPTLVKAIQQSRIAITVFSKDYASSSFCLKELATILRCSRKKNLKVFPVFYKVDPSDMRSLKGYKEALAKHSKKLNPNTIKILKNAPTQVAKFAGFHFHDGYYEHKFIEGIVESVYKEINESEASIYVADHPVGLESQVQKMRNLLEDGSSDGVHMIGIHGMGGVGKSTLARLVYNLISSHFDASCFLQNVREESNKHGLKHLRNILLSQVLEKKEINLGSELQETSMMQTKLKRKKVLLILDDVDEHKQLQKIVGKPHSFGPGSRIIITTRDKQLLASYGVKRTSEVKGLSRNDAVRLLKLKAFQTEDEVDPSYNQVLNDVVTCASGLPLALEVMGSNLFGKSIREWESAIKQYKRIPEKEILKILRVSFDALEAEEKDVFLDIACCLKGYNCTEIENILRGLYDNCMQYHIGVLIDKSLIKITDDKVTLHDLIEDMGKEIDRQKSPKEPGKRRRLWLQKDIIQILKDNSGSSEIKIIRLDFLISEREETVEWDGNGFKEMKDLKVLIIRNDILSQAPNYLPESLIKFEWHRHPSN